MSLSTLRDMRSLNSKRHNTDTTLTHKQTLTLTLVRMLVLHMIINTYAVSLSQLPLTLISNPQMNDCLLEVVVKDLYPITIFWLLSFHVAQVNQLLEN